MSVNVRLKFSTICIYPGVPDRSTLQLFIVPDYLLERSMIVPERSISVPERSWNMSVSERSMNRIASSHSGIVVYCECVHSI
jgi:hypothetical protein